MLTKSAILDLTYNTLANQVNLLQQQRQLSNNEMEMILIRVLQDIQTARLVESADTILKLTQQVEMFEKKEAEHDKSDDQS